MSPRTLSFLLPSGYFLAFFAVFMIVPFLVLSRFPLRVTKLFDKTYVAYAVDRLKVVTRDFLGQVGRRQCSDRIRVDR